MIDQPELDLRPHAPSPSPARSGFAGYSPRQLALLLGGAIALLWAVWVTRMLVAPRREQIVSARLSSLIGEYVQAEARSSAPRTQVEAEMRRFMTTLDRELQRRSARGEVVLVGEAVLTRNVPDITDALRRAVAPTTAARPSLPSGAPTPPSPALANSKALDAGRPDERSRVPLQDRPADEGRTRP